MSNCTEKSGSPDHIVALEFMTNAQLEARLLLLTHTPPPHTISRALLITAVAYETLRLSHRRRITARDPRGATHVSR